MLTHTRYEVDLLRQLIPDEAAFRDARPRVVSAFAAL